MDNEHRMVKTMANEITIIQGFDPENGDRYITLHEIHALTLPVDPHMPLIINGIHYVVLGKRSVAIDISEYGQVRITTTITVDRKYDH